jgi:cytidylate kinase
MKNDPSVVAAFLKARERERWKRSDGTNPLVTISRQLGSDGDAIAFRVAERLTALSFGNEPWLVVDKTIAQRVIDDHHLPKRISEFLTNEQEVTIQDHIEGLFGISVPRETIIEKMTNTMLKLANIGHVVLVGRASHIVTQGFPRAVHVRIIGSVEKRAVRLMAERGCSREVAEELIRHGDWNSQSFVKTHFHADLDNMLRYDMVFNTDRVPVEDASRMISELISSPDFRREESQHMRELREKVIG